MFRWVGRRDSIVSPGEILVLEAAIDSCVARAKEAIADRDKRIIDLTRRLVEVEAENVSLHEEVSQRVKAAAKAERHEDAAQARVRELEETVQNHEDNLAQHVIPNMQEGLERLRSLQLVAKLAKDLRESQTDAGRAFIAGHLDVALEAVRMRPRTEASHE